MEQLNPTSDYLKHHNPLRYMFFKSIFILPPFLLPLATTRHENRKIYSGYGVYAEGLCEKVSK